MQGLLLNHAASLHSLDSSASCALDLKTSLLNGLHFLIKIKESSTSVPLCELQRKIKNSSLVCLPIMTFDKSVTDVRSLNSQGPLQIMVSEESCPSTPATMDTESIDEVSCPSTPDELSIVVVDTQKIPSWEPQPSLWKPLCHPRVDEVSLEVDKYFLHNWKFPSVKAAKAFTDAAFSRVTCLYFPLARDDRIHFACRLLTVLFLIDGKKKKFLTIFNLLVLPAPKIKKRDWG